MSTNSNSKALVRRSSDSQLMPPPPPTKRIKRPQKVLDEDAYTDALSHIIRRDFFPGLAESDAQQEYLDALESRDVSWISSAGKRLQETMTPVRGRRGAFMRQGLAGATPVGYAGDTPASVVSAASSRPAPSDAPDTSLSLDNFQAKYTSEDNESFYKLLDKQNEKRAEKYAWLWNNNHLASNRELAQKKVEDRLLQSRESLIDDGGERKVLAIRDVHEKPAMPDSWKSRPDNNLMFRPDGIEDAMESTAQRAQADSRAAPKQIVYGNTRLSAPDAESTQVPPSPSLSAVRDAIAGRKRPGYSESSIEQSGGETPRVNGYAFVDDEPDDEIEPPRRLREINLGSGDATPNPFNIKKQSKREDLHHRLVDRASKSKRESERFGLTGKVAATPVPRFPSSPRVGAGSLTPAAQRLWSKVGSSRSGNSSSPFQVRTPATPKQRESGLKVRWTPKASDK